MSLMSESEIIIIDKNKETCKSNLWCKVCKTILITAEDIEREKESSCCEECWLAFVEGKSDKWSKKTQPDKETLKRYKHERSILNISISDIIGENK
jgi:hypothetical protein